MTDDDYDIIHSPLERKVERDGITVEIFIYRGAEEDGWILEVQDHEGGSTVWDDRFATDREAHDEAMRSIDEDGIGSFAAAVGIKVSV
jgi:hypothetical protein